MNVKPTTTTASAPIVDYSGRIGHLLVGCNDAPTTPTDLGAKLDDLGLGKSDLR